MSAIAMIRGEADAAAWDARVSRALGHAPPRVGRAVAWLRHPPRRRLRMAAGVLLVVGGLFSILPILGLWMLPLGLALLGRGRGADERVAGARGARHGKALGADAALTSGRVAPRHRRRE